MNRNEVLFKACKILDANSINYWICNGTLLGIIRENRILPWDHDIDIAVWENEISKSKIMELFTNEGFATEPYFGEMDCIDFVIDGTRLDISFYNITNDIASVKWLLPARGIVQKIIFIVSSVFSTNNFPKYWIKYWPLKKIITFIIALLSFTLKVLFPSHLRKKIARKGFNRIGYKGYSYPTKILQPSEYNYNGNIIYLPAKYEEVLINTYGKDWRIPKKDYIWDQEAENLIDL